MQNRCAAAIRSVVFLNVVLGSYQDQWLSMLYHSITKLVKNGFVTSITEGSLSSQT